MIRSSLSSKAAVRNWARAPLARIALAALVAASIAPAAAEARGNIVRIIQDGTGWQQDVQYRDVAINPDGSLTAAGRTICHGTLIYSDGWNPLWNNGLSTSVVIPVDRNASSYAENNRDSGGNNFRTGNDTSCTAKPTASMAGNVPVVTFRGTPVHYLAGANAMTPNDSLYGLRDDKGNVYYFPKGSQIISQDGSGFKIGNQLFIVAQGGGNIVAQGGGNIVAQGGGNIVAQGGGNIVAQGGGNLALTIIRQIVAQGGGNIVAQGGGNFAATDLGKIFAVISNDGSTLSRAVTQSVVPNSSNLVGNSGSTLSLQTVKGSTIVAGCAQHGDSRIDLTDGSSCLFNRADVTSSSQTGSTVQIAFTTNKSASFNAKSVYSVTVNGANHDCKSENCGTLLANLGNKVQTTASAPKLMGGCAYTGDSRITMNDGAFCLFNIRDVVTASASGSSSATMTLASYPNSPIFFDGSKIASIFVQAQDEPCNQSGYMACTAVISYLPTVKVTHSLNTRVATPQVAVASSPSPTPDYTRAGSAVSAAHSTVSCAPQDPNVVVFAQYPQQFVLEGTDNLNLNLPHTYSCRSTMVAQGKTQLSPVPTALLFDPHATGTQPNGPKLTRVGPPMPGPTLAAKMHCPANSPPAIVFNAYPDKVAFLSDATLDANADQHKAGCVRDIAMGLYKLYPLPDALKLHP